MAKPHFIESLKETLKQFKDEHRTIAKAVDEIEGMLSGMLSSKSPKRRGRPPGSTSAVKRGRPPGSGKKANALGKTTKKPAGKKAGKKAAKKAGTRAAKQAAPKRQAKAGGRQWTPEQKRAAAERLAAARAAKKNAGQPEE